MTNTKADDAAYLKTISCPYCGKLNCGYNDNDEYNDVKNGGCKND